MDCKKMGTFIANLRKEKNITQKDLADKLNITDRAISKWERGICCSDISLLIDLSEILDVSVNEILLGEKIKNISKKQADKITIDSIKSYNKELENKILKTWLITFSILLFMTSLLFLSYFIYMNINNEYFIDGTVTVKYTFVGIMLFYLGGIIITKFNKKSNIMKYIIPIIFITYIELFLLTQLLGNNNQFSSSNIVPFRTIIFYIQLVIRGK